MDLLVTYGDFKQKTKQKKNIDNYDTIGTFNVTMENIKLSHSNSGYENDFS